MLSSWKIILTFTLLFIFSITGEASESSDDEVTCTHLDKTYKSGESIDTPDNPCLACQCRRGWTKPEFPTCASIECPGVVFQLRPGCTKGEVPPGKCCPIITCPPYPKNHN